MYFPIGGTVGVSPSVTPMKSCLQERTLKLVETWNWGSWSASQPENRLSDQSRKVIWEGLLNSDQRWDGILYPQMWWFRYSEKAISSTSTQETRNSLRWNKTLSDIFWHDTIQKKIDGAEIVLPSGKRLQKTMENHHANGKIHYFYGHFQ